MMRGPDIGAVCGDIRQRFALSAVAISSGVKLKRAGREWKACCPFHADRSPSFTIYSGDRRFMCFGCGAEGDVLDFLRMAHGVSLKDAIDMLDRGAMSIIQIAPSGPVKPDIDRGDEARAIWADALPIDGTPAEAYLRRRGIRAALPGCLAFARLRYGSRGPTHPVLVASICSPTSSVIGVQRTYLTQDGSKAAFEKPKLSLGRVRGGGIQLAPAAADLIVCEGLEDGLTLLQALGLPVWVSAGTAMMPSMSFPQVVRHVTIGADGDAAGEEAAQLAAAAYGVRGLRVRIMRPAPGFKDFNAELLGQRL